VKLRQCHTPVCQLSRSALKGRRRKRRLLRFIDESELTRREETTASIAGSPACAAFGETPLSLAEKNATIKGLLLQRRLSQREVGLLIGTSKTTGGRIERGRRDPTLVQLLAFANLYGAHEAELFAGRYQEIGASVRARCRALRDELRGAVRPDRSLSRKLESLSSLIAGDEGQ
jgi:transcriptional regulator with XRE-family HTH domain